MKQFNFHKQFIPAKYCLNQYLPFPNGIFVSFDAGLDVRFVFLEVSKVFNKVEINCTKMAFKTNSFNRLFKRSQAIFPMENVKQLWRIQRLIWAHREREARSWENQLGVCKPPSGYRAEFCWWTGGEAPGNFDDLLVKITFLKLNMPFYET